MPTANQDSSLLTQRKRNQTLYYWNKVNNALVNAGQSVRREQPDTQLQTIVTERKQVSANQNLPDTCPCAVAVDRNTGGNDSNNVQ